MNKLKVGVLFGGSSVEHDISIVTAMQVMASLDEKKYEIFPLYLTRSGKIVKTSKFKSQKEMEENGITLSEKQEVRLQGKIKGKNDVISKIDLIVCAFHGKNLESGEIYGYLKTLNIPCTSCGVISAGICQSKVITKMILKSNNIKYIDYVYFDKLNYYSDKDKYYKMIESIGYPVIVKADQLGSSIGISVCNNVNEIKKAIEIAFMYDERIIIERKINKFIEYNCAYLRTYDDKIISSVEEIIKDDEKMYDFDDKYKNREIKSKIIKEDTPITNEIKKITKNVIDIIDGYGVLRCDYIYDIEEKKLYLNEINSIPGALSYYLFEHLGLYFDELLNKLINGAIKRKYYEDIEIKNYKSDVLEYRREEYKNK